ncbi:MAG: helix-turn-helix transcriptional regulator [Bacilli bacterium]|nr:helix-turn-helix transcriptional regulator [Bacilli bacterium]
MNSEKLQNLLLNAIDKKGISQRELARLSGISRSTLNDIVNGKIKKIKLDDLYQIANILELNLENLLEACGFKGVISSLNVDRYEGMSDRELKELLDKYSESEFELLDWDAKKRKQCSEVGKKLFDIQNRIETSEKLNKNYTKKEISEDIKRVIEELKPIQQKYDYSKLPRNK